MLLSAWLWLRENILVYEISISLAKELLVKAPMPVLGSYIHLQAFVYSVHVFGVRTEADSAHPQPRGSLPRA